MSSNNQNGGIDLPRPNTLPKPKDVQERLNKLADQGVAVLDRAASQAVHHEPKGAELRPDIGKAASKFFGIVFGSPFSKAAKVPRSEINPVQKAEVDETYQIPGASTDQASESAEK